MRVGKEILHSFLAEGGVLRLQEQAGTGREPAKAHMEQGSYARSIGVVFLLPRPARPHGSVLMPIALYYIFLVPVVPLLHVLQSSIGVR